MHYTNELDLVRAWREEKSNGFAPHWDTDRTINGAEAEGFGGGGVGRRLACNWVTENVTWWAQPWGCSASTSCVIFTACCLMFPGNRRTQLPPHSSFRSPSMHLYNINKTLWLILWYISRWSEGRTLWQIVEEEEEEREMEEGAAGLVSEAWLMIVPVLQCCQPWQWNMISPSPLLLLTNHGWDFREVGESGEGWCSARAALLRWWWWFGARDEMGWEGW